MNQSETDDIDNLAAAMAAVHGDDDHDHDGNLQPASTSTSTSTSPPSTPNPTPTALTRTTRASAKLVPAFDTAEGAGARVKRTIGTPALWNVSPFLILDYARVRPGEGFPDHPHRGMATVTYVLEGTMQHEDFLGNAGRLGVGDVQWMTAGRGIVHSEMPYFDPEDPSPPDAVALQLWIDLPAGKKMVKPSYKERKAATLAHATFDGGSVTIVSGESHGVTGPIRPIGGCWFLDFRLAGATWQDIPAGWTAFVYVLEGRVVVGGGSDTDEDGDGENDSNEKGTAVDPHTACVLTSHPSQTGVRLSSRKAARFVLIAGEPLQQPMILQGPFVVTSKDAAVQALRDFQSGRNGFEKALGWQSEIGKMVGRGGERRVGKGGRKKGAGGGGGGGGGGGKEGWEERDKSENKRGHREKAKDESGGGGGGGEEEGGKGKNGRGRRR